MVNPGNVWNNKMKLRQLRFIREVVKQGLNISAAAQALFTSQPGVSTQIRLLEEELGVRIFERSGRHLSGITPAGEKILALAEEMLATGERIKLAAREFSEPDRGSLSIATTHTQARYALPDIVKRFRQRYPDVSIHLQQGTPMQISEMAAKGDVDLAIATEAIELFDDLVMLPCYHWNRCILTPCDHPLRDEKALTLEAVAEYPIITYVFGFTGRSQLDRAFNSQGLSPNVVITAADTDVIKTYVRLGLGIGIIANMAYDPRVDTDLCALDASHLFTQSTTRIGLRRGTFLRQYQYDFIHAFAPHLDKASVDRALQTHANDEVAELFMDKEMPVR
jgi:LysR family transcriptional regulator, cys regulon transcriptional activator